MAPPKRAHFSLNVNSQAESLYSRVEDGNTKDHEGRPKVKVIESSGPTSGSKHLEFVTKPFEKIVDRTVEGVLDGTGKHVDDDSIEGHTNTETRTRTSDNTGPEGHWTVTRNSAKLKTRHVDNRSSKSKKNRIWEEYDTSEL
jgi:ribose 5-phosphate isomerase B